MPRALTSAEASSSQPAWSPDGRRVAFVRKPPKDGKEAKPQVWVMSADGGEPEKVTALPLGALDPRWFPDGRRIAFLAPVIASDRTLEGTRRILKAREEDPVKAAVTEDRVYRYWDRWLTDGQVHHLFALDLGTGKVADLIPDSRRWLPLMDPAGSWRISPDGGEAAFTACRSKPPHSPLLWGVFAVRGGRTRLVSGAQEGNARDPAYSPDGRFLVYGVQRDIAFYADRVRLVVHDRRTGHERVLLEDWDLSPEGWEFGADGRLYFAAEAEGRRAIFALDALNARKGGAPRELRRGGWLSDPHAAGGRIFATLESLASPPEAVSFRTDGRGLRRLTSFTKGRLKGIRLGRIQEARIPGADGRRIQVLLVHPPGPARRKRPLLQQVHGGPHGVFGDQWHWRWNPHAFAAPGRLVAMVNFHGSTGWGQDFAASIQGRWGDQPYRDVMAATDWLVGRGLADPARMAAAGGSYGGYLVSWIASQTDRFRCLVNHAGVSDFQAQYASDVTHGRRKAMGGEPWENLAGMDRWNPMRHAKGFRTPMLVLHGERDFRVPFGQGLEIYAVLRAMGIPGRLVVYPDENHWILKPRNSLHWYGEVLGWLRRWRV